MRPTVIWYFSVGCFLGCFLAQSVYADTILATSCSREDVQAAMDTAQDGDSVEVPPGSCIWTGRVNVANLKVEIMGAGIDQTIIIFQPIVTSNTAAFWITGDKVFRISGFTFKGNPSDKGVIHLRGVVTGFRIDNNKFDNINGKSIDLQGGNATTVLSGLIDHNEFGAGGLLRGMNLSGDGEAQVYQWEIDWTPGTGDAVFIEDNVFDHTNRYPEVSCHRGCRYVFRYNTVINGSISTHGADSTDRAGGVIEAYNNTFTGHYEHPNGLRMRGGTAIIFNNTWTGYAYPIELAQFRTCYGVGYTGSRTFPTVDNKKRCDGSDATGIFVVDGNLARTGDSGTHDGAGNAATLTDSGKSFTTSEFVGFHIRNTTDGSLCKVTANDATTVTCTLAGGTDNDWDASDAYEITSGWPCRDQVGRGPNQASEPVYQWNNTWSRNGTGGPYISPTFHIGGYLCENPSPEDQIRKNQDYFDNTPRPNYTPYMYPHPLTLEGNSPKPPRNLRIALQ